MLTGSPSLSTCGANRAAGNAFDLLELNGMDLRAEPIEVRKATLASILRKSRHGVRLNEHLEHPEGDVVFRHACKMGLVGIVSKRLGSTYRSGRSTRLAQVQEPGGVGSEARS
jgi:bifunctional non-homologous end joining protein LigD